MSEKEQITKKNPDSKAELRQLFLDIGFWWRYLVGQWKIIVPIGLLGVLIGFLYAAFSEPEYKANVDFVLEGSGSKTSNLGNIAAMAGVNVGGSSSAFEGENIVELYKSRNMLSKALISPSENGESLIDQYMQINDIKEKWEDKPDLQKIDFNDLNENHSYKADSVLNKFVKHIRNGYLNVEKPEEMKSRVHVSIQTPNEEFSKRFAETLVQTVNNFYIETKTKKEQENKDALQAQADSVRAELDQAITDVAREEETTPNPNASRASLNVPSSKRQVDVEVNKAIIKELVKNLEVSKVNLRQNAPLIQIIDKPILPLEEIRTGKLKSMVIGGFIAGFLIVAVLVAREYYRQVMVVNDENSN